MSRFLHSSTADKYFAECHAKGWLYESAAPRGAVPTNLTFGIAAHAVMESYVNHCVENGRRSDITIVGDLINAAVARAGLSLLHYDELSLLIREFLKVYEIDVEHSISREGGIAFDDELNVIDWSDGLEYERMTTASNSPMAIAQQLGVFWRLKPDHVLYFPEDRTLVVQDYKSDIYAPSKTKIQEPSSRFLQQAKKLAWATWRALFPADVVRVDFIFMRHVAYGKPLTRSLTFHKDEILETQDLTLQKARLVEALSEFPATAGDHCASCAWRETACPIREARQDDDPADIMRRYLYGRVVVEALRERLKEFIAEYGFEGALGPLRAVFAQAEKDIPDMERVWRFLQENGIEKPWALLNLSKTDAERVLDKDLAKELLASAYDPELEVRFNVHQPKEVLVALCEARGIETQKMGKTKLKDRTVAELAWDLAQSGDGDTPATTREEPIPVDLSTMEVVS